MSPVIQNILWCAGGIVAGMVIIRMIQSIRLKKSAEPAKGVSRKQISASKPKTHENTEKMIKEEENVDPIQVLIHPEGSARDAFVANVSNLQKLFEALNKGTRFGRSINDAIIEINNKELMDIWVKINRDHKAVMRILAMWGIRREDEMKFQPQKHHEERYELSDGQTYDVTKTYEVVTPCWIHTHTGEDGVISKTVIIKGKAAEI